MPTIGEGGSPLQAMSKFCAECGARRADGATTCAVCGTQFPTLSSDEAGATEPDAPPVEPDTAGADADGPETRSDLPPGEPVTPGADADAAGATDEASDAGPAENVFQSAPPWARAPKRPRIRIPKLDKRLLVGAAAILIAAVGATAIWQMGVFSGGGSAAADSHERDLTLLPVRYGETCGYVDGEGRLVINPQFQSAGFFGDDGLAPVQVGDRWGLINRRGEFVVNAQYEGLARAGLPRAYHVSVGRQIGVIDERGRMVINPQFQSLTPFDSAGLAAAQVGGKWGMVDRSGAFVIPPQFDQIRLPHRAASDGGRYFEAGLVAAAVDDKWGFIDKTGAWVVNPQFDMVGDFEQRSGLAPVMIAETTQTTDEAAASAWDARESAAQDAWATEQGRRAEYYARWGSQYRPQARQRPTRPDFTRTNTTQKWAYVDRQGRLAIPRQYDWAREFNESGLAPVNVGQRWGYIDTSGKPVVAPQYRNTRAMRRVGSDWVGVVQTGADGASYSEWRFGLVDSTGKVRINPQFSSLSDFEDGRALVRLGDNVGVIDAQGRYIINPGYSVLRRNGRGGEYLYVRTSGVAGGAREMGRLSADGRVLSRVTGDLCASEE